MQICCGKTRNVPLIPELIQMTAVEDVVFVNQSVSPEKRSGQKTAAVYQGHKPLPFQPDIQSLTEGAGQRVSLHPAWQLLIAAGTASQQPVSSHLATQQLVTAPNQPANLSARKPRAITTNRSDRSQAPRVSPRLSRLKVWTVKTIWTSLRT